MTVLRERADRLLLLCDACRRGAALGRAQRGRAAAASRPRGRGRARAPRRGAGERDGAGTSVPAARRVAQVVAAASSAKPAQTTHAALNSSCSASSPTISGPATAPAKSRGYHHLDRPGGRVGAFSAGTTARVKRPGPGPAQAAGEGSAGHDEGGLTRDQQQVAADAEREHGHHLPQRLLAAAVEERAEPDPALIVAAEAHAAEQQPGRTLGDNDANHEESTRKATKPTPAALASALAASASAWTLVRPEQGPECCSARTRGATPAMRGARAAAATASTAATPGMPSASRTASPRRAATAPRAGPRARRRTARAPKAQPLGLGGHPPA